MIFALVASAASAFGALLASHCLFLIGPDKQLLVEGLQRRSARRGPAFVVLPPWPFRKNVTVREPWRLQAGEFAVVLNTLDGTLRNEAGPTLLFLDAYEEVVGGKVRSAISLSATEYVVLKDQTTGAKRAIRGPAMCIPEPKEDVIKGPESAITLKTNEYVRLIDTETGSIRVERGEKLVWPSATEKNLLSGQIAKHTALSLESHQYVRVIDHVTGVPRIARGPALVFLGATESFYDEMPPYQSQAAEVDEEHAVLIRDMNTGQLRLEQTKQLFFPEPHEAIVKVQERIILAAHECVIVKDPQGSYLFFSGGPMEGCQPVGSFFVPPHHSVVELWWSAGRRRESRRLCIKILDCRPMYMSFEFNARTSDNVDLVLEGTFFWQIVNVPQMIKTTGDTSGDVCNHARSKVIQLVSQYTLKEFMANFQGIAQKSHEANNEFYTSRGVNIHKMEITQYRCANKEDQAVLQQIIQETTNRMNRLQKQESENEVALAKLSGQVKEKEAQGELLELQRALARKEAETIGEVEAARVQQFLQGLAAEVGGVDDRLALWRMLRRNEALTCLADGNAKLYFTHEDANLVIKD